MSRRGAATGEPGRAAAFLGVDTRGQEGAKFNAARLLEPAVLLRARDLVATLRRALIPQRVAHPSLYDPAGALRSSARSAWLAGKNVGASVITPTARGSL